MKDANELAGLQKLLHLDIRLEVILADLVNENMGVEDLLILNNSLFQRNYHNDIEKVEFDQFGKANKQRLCFTVNRSGLYDNLPEDVFHQPTDIKNGNGKEGVLQEFKIQEDLEKSARKFFIPYEQEFYRQRIKLEIEERKYLFETNSNVSDEMLTQLWEFPDHLDRLQKSKLGVLMPVIHRIVGDYPMTAFIIENITGDQVDMAESHPLSFVAENNMALGRSILGINTMLGGEIRDLQRSVTVKIGLKDQDDLTDYMPGGKKNKIYEFLCNLLIPLENDVVYELYLEDHSGFEMNDENVNAGRLNYTTII